MSTLSRLSVPINSASRILRAAPVSRRVQRTQWYPATLLYRSQDEFPFFIRATQHKHFLKLVAITGISDADDLRSAVKAAHERLNGNIWQDFLFHFSSFWNYLNMDKLDTLK